MSIQAIAAYARRTGEQRALARIRHAEAVVEWLDQDALLGLAIERLRDEIKQKDRDIVLRREIID
jgi:hypothetical protein